MTAAEAADQARAGITRTESAFAYGNKLFDQTWGGSAADPYVAAAGNVAADPAGQQAASEDVLGLMEAYRDEPRLGAVSRRESAFAALGEARGHFVAEERSASSKLRSPETLGAAAAAAAGVAAMAAVAATASRRRGAQSASDALERVALMA